MRRLYLFFAFMGLFSAAFYGGSLVQVPSEQAQEILDQLSAIVDGIDGSGIFFHNVAIALAMFVPGAGAVWGMFSAFSTGMAFSAITTARPELLAIHPLTILYLSPFGIMELVAYSLATSRSYMLAEALIRKVPVRRQALPGGIEVGVVVGLLLAGGYLEHYLIQLAKETDISLPGF